MKITTILLFTLWMQFLFGQDSLPVVNYASKLNLRDKRAADKLESEIDTLTPLHTANEKNIAERSLYIKNFYDSLVPLQNRAKKMDDSISALAEPDMRNVQTLASIEAMSKVSDSLRYVILRPAYQRILILADTVKELLNKDSILSVKLREKQYALLFLLTGMGEGELPPAMTVRVYTKRKQYVFFSDTTTNKDIAQ